MKMKIFTALLIALTFLTPHAFPEESPAVIENGKSVKLNYTLTVDGKVIDSSEGKAPMTFVFGQNRLVPGLEKGILGLKRGDKKSLTLPPEEAYGPANPQAIVEAPKASFQAKDIQPGMAFSASGAQGEPMTGVVKELRGDMVVLDFNHPLAGKTLLFDIEVLEVK